MIYVKSIDNDVTQRKIFTIINILAIFMFLNMANLLRSCYRTVPSAIWETFSEFRIFCNLFHEPLGE